MGRKEKHILVFVVGGFYTSFMHLSGLQEKKVDNFGSISLTLWLMNIKQTNTESKKTQNSPVYT